MLSQCASLVREHDYDRYLCTLFAPASVREAWFALFAFNHEIASIGELVSEEMIGFMRFAWWREALDEIYAGGTVRRHPVAQALAEAVRGHRLARAPFDAMLDAREANMRRDITQALQEDEGYFRATSSSLLVLCAAAAGMEASTALIALGVAWAAVGTARVMKAAGEENALLLQLAETRLSVTRGVPGLFAPFRHTADFYVRRLKRGKPVGREARFALVLRLCLRKLF